jgi:hypothetical protein
MWARGLSFVVGVWLMLSVWIFPHGTAQGLNTVLCGGAAMLLSVLAMGWPPVRYLNALLGVWLIASLGILPGTGLGLFWSSLLSGLLMIAVALTEAPPERGRRAVA